MSEVSEIVTGIQQLDAKRKETIETLLASKVKLQAEIAEIDASLKILGVETPGRQFSTETRAKMSAAAKARWAARKATAAQKS